MKNKKARGMAWHIFFIVYRVDDKN